MGAGPGLNDAALRLTVLAPSLAGVIALVHVLKRRADRVFAAERDALQYQQRVREVGRTLVVWPRPWMRWTR